MACNSTASINIKTIANLAAIKLTIDGFKEIVSITASFEEQMSKVQAVSQAGAEDLARLSERARELGRDTIFTATEAGKGMEELARLGFTVKENYQSIESVLNLAASSALGLGRASEIVAGSLRSFGEGADQARKFVDILATTAASSGTTVDLIGESLKHAGAIANTAGISFAEFNAVLGAFGDRLIRGEQAGTGFRQLIVGISTQAPKGAKALKELGLTYADIDVSTKGLIPVLQLLKERFDNVEGAQRRLQLAADIWGRRQFNAALQALDSVDKIDELTKAYKRNENAAKRMADVMVDNLAGDFKLFRSAVQEVALKIGDTLSPALRQVTQNFTEMSREAARTGETLNNIGKVLGTVVLSFDILINGLLVVKNGFKVVLGEIEGFFVRFAKSTLETMADWAHAVGATDISESLRQASSNLNPLLNEINSYIKDASDALGQNALHIEDSWGKIKEIWKDGPKSLSQVDTTPIFDGVEKITNAIKKALLDGKEDIELSVETLTDILRFGRIVDNFDVNKLSEETKKKLDIYISQLITLFQEAGQEINPQILEFSKRLQGLGDAVGEGGKAVKDNIPELEDGLGKVVHSIDTSIGKIQVESDKLQSALSNILGYDKEKILKDAAELEAVLSEIKISGIQLDPEQQDRLNKQVEEVVEGLRKIKESVPELTKELGSSLGLWVSGFGEMGAAAQGAAGSVEDAAKRMSGDVKATSESFDEGGGTFNVYAQRAADAMQRSTKVIEEYDQKTGRVTKSIVAHNREAEESAKGLGKGYEELGEKSKSVGEEQENAAGKVDKSSESLDRMASISERLSEKMKEAGGAVSVLAEKGTSLESSLRNSSGAAAELSDNVGKVSDKLNTIGSQTVSPKIDSSSLVEFISLLDQAKAKQDVLLSDQVIGSGG